ncbi:SPOR domain-containing protein [Tistrella bauzanensis]|uniref:SPOR domain-containing protein n=1 Tax=Tistrella arctica TaxID=3133430 RepID=A0ABU9YHC7_9PROT
MAQPPLNGDDDEGGLRAEPRRPAGGPRPPRTEAFEPATRLASRRHRLRPFAVAAAALLFAGLVWYAFDQRDASMRDAPPPLIAADSTPMKTLPKEPGGMDVPHRDKTVYDALGGSGTAPSSEPERAPVERLLPPPEEPILPEPSDDEAALADAGEAMAPDQMPDQATGLPAEPQASVPPEPEPAPAAPEPAAPAPATPAPTPAPQAVKPTPAPVETPKPVDVPKPVETPKPVEPPKAPDLRDVRTGADATAGIAGWKVQLGAFSDEAAARKGWDTLRARNKELVAGLQPAIVPVKVKDKGTLYRLQAGPLADGGAAKALCERFAKAKLACFPVAP